MTLEPPLIAISDDVVELRTLRVLGSADAEGRPPGARFLAEAPEHRFAVHRRGNGLRVGRIHLRLTTDPTILRAVGHAGFEIDALHRRQGYASRALRLVAVLARQHGLDSLWVLIAPHNTASRRTAERAGFELIDIVPASPEALGLSLDPELCRYFLPLDTVESPAGASGAR